MNATTEPQPAGDEQEPNPFLADIQRVIQLIEDSKPNLICAPADEARLAEALERKQMGHMVNVHASRFCKPGEFYVALSTRKRFGHSPEVS